MFNYLQQKNSSNSNAAFIGIAVVCICILVVYQFTFGTLIAANNRSINQLIYESLSADAALINNNISSQLTNITTNGSTIIQHLSSNNDDYNKTKINNISENRNRLLFADNEMWFQEKISNYSKDLSLLDPFNKTKRILFWNKAFGGGLGIFGSSHEADWFRALGCPIWQCSVSQHWDNPHLAPVEDYDAVLIHDPTRFNISLPAKRSPHQVYVWYNREPPGKHSYLKQWDSSSNLFNLTWTYRWDSDVVFPYGFFRPITNNHQSVGQIKDNYAEGKSKLVAWLVSNCAATNGRLDYAHRLQRHIPVDIYGKCGTFKSVHCAPGRDVECRQMMGRDYKFALAFENSMCRDYITEKYFATLEYNMVPIVMDLDGNYAKIVPAGSYINALDFPTVKALADYLKMLDKNDTLYNEYFSWKKHYILGDFYKDSMCQLCSKLHVPSSVSVYKNLTKWWHNDATCKVVAFPSLDDNDTWIAKDFNPPYDGQWPHGAIPKYYFKKY